MKKQNWIELVRSVLNIEHTRHLYEISLETDDVSELRQLLEDANSLTKTYINDYNYCLSASVN